MQLLSPLNFLLFFQIPKSSRQITGMTAILPLCISIHRASQTPKALEEKTYSKEDVRGILAGESAKGYGKEVKALLSKYGADKFSTLSPEHYAAVVAVAEEIGNE